MFDSEREKEFFYVETSIRRLNSPVINVLNSCRILKNLALVRQLLNNYEKMMHLPKSFVCVHEDFHYMRGKNGANEVHHHVGGVISQSWPESSIFNARDPTTPMFNETLSMTCPVNEIEKLKECLFQDPFNARSTLVKLRENGRAMLLTTMLIFVADVNMRNALISRMYWMT